MLLLQFHHHCFIHPLEHFRAMQKSVRHNVLP